MQLEVQDQQSISSLEIARITGKRHDHLMEAIRTMEEAWVKQHQPKFRVMFKITKLGNGAQRKDPYYNLNKEECLYIATKFNDEARAKLILRWKDLETRLRDPLAGFKFKQLNGKEWFPYRTFLEYFGFSIRSGSYSKRMRHYRNDFMSDADGVVYASKEMCMVILKYKELHRHREVLAKNNKQVAFQTSPHTPNSVLLSLFDDIVKIEDKALRQSITDKLIQQQRK